MVHNNFALADSKSNLGVYIYSEVSAHYLGLSKITDTYKKIAEIMQELPIVYDSLNLNTDIEVSDDNLILIHRRLESELSLLLNSRNNNSSKHGFNKVILNKNVRLNLYNDTDSLINSLNNFYLLIDDCIHKHGKLLFFHSVNLSEVPVELQKKFKR